MNLGRSFALTPTLDTVDDLLNSLSELDSQSKLIPSKFIENNKNKTDFKAMYADAFKIRPENLSTFSQLKTNGFNNDICIKREGHITLSNSCETSLFSSETLDLFEKPLGTFSCVFLSVPSSLDIPNEQDDNEKIQTKFWTDITPLNPTPPSKDTRNEETCVVEVIPRETDVKFGRGTGPNLWPGNVAMRELVKKWQTYYNDPKCTVTEKTKLSQHLVGVVQNQNGGRFIKFERGSWRVVSNEDARIKISTTLRSKLTLSAYAEKRRRYPGGRRRG
jgi:hypothetical protein